MKKILAVSIVASLVLLSPGTGGWAQAAQVFVPQGSVSAGSTGGAAGAAGAGAVQGRNIGAAVPALTPIDAAGALPGVSLYSPAVSPAGVPSALALPVAQGLAPPINPGGARVVPGGEAAPSLRPAFQGNEAEAGRAEAGTQAPGQRRTGVKGLFKALSLPSLFKKGAASTPEEARGLAQDDFSLHTAGASGESSNEAPLPSARSVSTKGGVKAESFPATRQGALARFTALAKLLGGGGSAGLRSGTLSLHTPDGPAKTMAIRSVGGEAEAPRRASSPAPSAKRLKTREAPAGYAPDRLAAADVPSPSRASAVSGKKAERRETERHYRSAFFPLTVAGIAAAALGMSVGALSLLYYAVPALLPIGVLDAVGSTAGLGAAGWIVQTVFGVAGGAALLSALYAFWETVVFTLGVAVREPVSDAEFYAFVRKELKSWNLHPSVRASLIGQGPGGGILKPYRPPSRFSGLAYGYTAGGAIYLRPELVRSPRLFRWVLKHELVHLERYYVRGPPARAVGLRRLLRVFFSEVGARLGEWRGVSSLETVRIPILERVLSSARLSLKRSKPYEVLLIHPGRHEVRNAEKYRELSGGLATVVELYTKGDGGETALQVEHDDLFPQAARGVSRRTSGDDAPDGAQVQAYLGREGNSGRYRMIVYPQSFATLPDRTSGEGRRLRRALHKLDRVYVLSRQLPLIERSGGFQLGQYQGTLGRLTGSLGIAWRPGMSAAELDKLIQETYFSLSRRAFGETSFVKTLESIYASLHHRGTALLPFAPGEPGFDEVQRILRYWRAEDGGMLTTSRVDLPEGGHVLVARKTEPRVDLWLMPAEGKSFSRSFTNVNTARSHTPSQERILRDAGFVDEDLRRFRDADMEVRHVFGGDVGDNRIYVNVRRSHAQLLRKYAYEAGISFAKSERFDLHLVESGPMQNAEKTWTLGFDGAGGRIYDIDTGLDVTHPDFADRELTSVDFVDEGPEDWIGHGTHKAGISYANGAVYRGMAPKALGRMGKVFAQNGTGASDGEIMAAAVDAMQWGADVISLSLGSPGTVEAPLAEFFSNLTKQKNANGEYPIVTGSAGNSGPFNSTKSQPSVGRYVASIAAAAKSLDDGEPEISFYSSVGPAYDRRYGVRRYRRPMGLTALGGDVTTPPDVKDVYSDGIESVKSKDMPPAPSDAEDGRHTRMSGTSMSNPMVAGIALLVKQAARSVIKSGTEAYDFFMEELPFAVNMILMRSARDMRVPIFFQEAGFVDALAAAELGARSFGGELVSAPRKAARALKALAGLLKRPAVSEGVAAGEAPFDWIRRVKRAWELEDRPYDLAQTARKARMNDLEKRLTDRPAGHPDAPFEGPRQYEIDKRELGDAGNAAFQKTFQAERTKIVPELLTALKDKVWLVRLYAAFALLNLQAPEAAVALADAALKDSDGRVRQTAFLALSETQSYAADEALKQGLSDPRPDVSIYAAYALARHGHLDGVSKIVEAARSEDKKIRFTAVWLLGQIGKRAPPEITDALSRRVVDTGERGNIRHLSVASLTEVAKAAPQSLTDETILNLLYSSGPQNFALTRTISKFFSAAASSADVRKRMSEKPLRDDIVKFIHKNKAAVNRPGALGELVRLLSRILNVPLDIPTPLPNPTGAGIAGVDPNLGPVHLIVEMPAAAEAGARIERFEDFRGRYGRGAQAQEAAAVSVARTLGLDPEMLGGHSAELQVAMPASQALWFNVPDANVFAFTTEMESRGYTVRRAQPMYRLLNDTGELSGMPAIREKAGLTGKGVLVAYLDEGGDTEHPAISKDRIEAKKNFTDDGGPELVEKESVSHGTHGMGIVGGRSVDGSPYVGMAPDVRFAVGKVLGETGGSEAAVMAGMEWAASLVQDPLKNPVVINMSLGGPGASDSPISLLVNKLRLKNIGVVAAAGNSGPMEGTVSSPANAALAVSVGAVDKAKELAEYSSRSPKGVRELSWVDFGGAVFFDRPNLYEIVSALNTRLRDAMSGAATGVKWKDKLLYHTMSGTSMAAPHTTGKISVLIERMKTAFPDGLPSGYLFFIEKLVEGAAAALPGRGENEVGAGLIDMGAALKALDKALANPEAVRAESESLIESARREYGGAPEVRPAGGWFVRMIKDVPAKAGAGISSLMSLFLFI